MFRMNGKARAMDGKERSVFSTVTLKTLTYIEESRLLAAPWGTMGGKL